MLVIAQQLEIHSNRTQINAIKINKIQNKVRKSQHKKVDNKKRNE